MLWVLKRISMRRFFEHPKHMFKLMDKKIIAILCSKILLNWPYGYHSSSYQSFTVLTLCRPIDFSLKFDIVKSGLSIVCIEGSRSF